ncbi:hypothetical protein DFH06DRAFT_1405452 [Mycena polygramma]|nr:hypothetical protein DFH06DRAFT_1405452 [Mycena polygramma]
MVIEVRSILSAASPNPALVNLEPSNEPSTTWIIDLSPGTSVILSVQDSTGDSGQSSTFSIHARATLGGGSCDGTSQGTGGGNGTTTVAPPNGGPVKIGSGNSTGTNGGDGNAGDSGAGDSGAGDSGTQGISDTSSSPGGSQASPSQGGSQASSPEAHGGSQPTPSQGSDSSSVPSGHNLSPVSPASDPSSSTSLPTSFAQSSGQSASASNSNSASGSSNSNEAIDSLASPTFTLPESLAGPGGQIQPATSVLQSGVSSSGTEQTGLSDNAAKKTVKSGPIIGGVIAAIVCVLLAAFCVLRRCRRRRPDAPDRLSYPFSMGDTEAAVRREMSGRSGYPASNFSSWGNRGDLDERALTPAGAGSSEGQPMWEAGYGTIESRYQAAFIPGHTASSSSIDRNDPTSHRRGHGAVPKSMTDTYHAEPSSPSTAIVEEQSHTTDLSDGNAARDFDEILPHAMPSWGTAHDMMAGRRPIVAGYPPPYTSR